MKKGKWIVFFMENGDEYQGSLVITAKKVTAVKGDRNSLIADGVRIRIDEPIIEIVQEEE